MAVDPVERVQQDPRSPYERVAVKLRDEILAGHLADGSPAPTQKEISAKYEVAPSTAQRALNLLKSWELIVGSGHGKRGKVAAPAGSGAEPSSSASEPAAPEKAGTTLLELRVLCLGDETRTLTVEADPDDADQLRRLLVAAARRHGGKDVDVADYEMEVRRAGERDLIQTFATL